MRVLHILHSTNIGGTERAVLNYLKYNEDSTVKNFVMSFNGGELDECYKKESDFYKATNSNKIMKNLIDIYSMIKDHEIDIVYAYGLRTSFLARIVSRLLKTKNIYGVRGLQKNSKGLIELYNKITMKYVDQIITNSDNVKRELIEKFSYTNTKIESVHNGTFFPLVENEMDYEDNTKLKIVCVANLHIVKGHLYLIKAISNLVNEELKLKLTLIGDGEHRRNLVAEIDKLGIKDNVEFLGTITDVYPELYQNHLFILPSLSEGLPNAVMEAMASGLPVICTDVGGSSELVEDMHNGMLIQPKSVEQIEKAIKYFYLNRTQIKLFGNRGRDKIKEGFSFERLVKKNNDIFKELMKR